MEAFEQSSTVVITTILRSIESGTWLAKTAAGSRQGRSSPSAYTSLTRLRFMSLIRPPRHVLLRLSAPPLSGTPI